MLGLELRQSQESRPPDMRVSTFEPPHIMVIDKGDRYDHSLTEDDQQGSMAIWSIATHPFVEFCCSVRISALKVYKFPSR